MSPEFRVVQLEAKWELWDRATPGGEVEYAIPCGQMARTEHGTNLAAMVAVIRAGATMLDMLYLKAEVTDPEVTVVESAAKMVISYVVYLLCLIR